MEILGKWQLGGSVAKRGQRKKEYEAAFIPYIPPSPRNTGLDQSPVETYGPYAASAHLGFKGLLFSLFMSL